MSRVASTIVAAAIALLAYALIAWLASFIAIPAEAPTARVHWLGPFRVVSTLGFWLASLLHVPHLVGGYLATILLGLLLGAVFALARLGAGGRPGRP